MFRNIINEEINIVLKKRKVVAQFKIIKKNKVHVNFMRLSSTKSMHLKKIVTRVIFCVLYITMNVIIEKIKKTIFNSDAEINCMSKELTNVIQLFIRQNINIIMINAINKRACFFNICEAVFINIENIIISISVFVVKRSDHKFLFKRFFQRAARMSFINMNNEFLEIMLHFLNEKK